MIQRIASMKHFLVTRAAQQRSHPPEPRVIGPRRKPSVKMLAMASALVLGAAGWLNPARAAPAAEVKEVMAKDLPDFPGKQGQMLLVNYPPGSVDHAHRHDAHAFVYVLEGTIVMQLKGSPPVTVHTGETFYEGPDDIHVVGRNASDSKPARFVVFFVKNKGAPILTLVP